jgi:pyruvate, orthophosphate dikinase
MIELPRACGRADEIAESADFCSLGTNDLTQTPPVHLSHDDAEGKFLAHYIERGGAPRSVAFCHRLGLDYVSSTLHRVAITPLATAQLADGLMSVAVGG